ncbi:hypothetical protein M0812_29766 [Anaeramoeba flamelloides]|uniref:Uncharacterized protein n=1 Tax=Anaeramoeba flamelloides TaxID=1746091 RepID=A0AAV7Y302_9EUKA|nr:hypothetical protein M0812_29766 [Anaeramoeba flamelloides]
MILSEVKVWLPVMSMLLLVSLFIIAIALHWLVHSYLPLKNSLEKHECTLIDKSYEKKVVCETKSKYTSSFSVEYTYKSNGYTEDSCNFGRYYTVKYQTQRFDLRKPKCSEYTDPDLDFYNKFSRNKSYECWVFKDKPEMSTLDYPLTNYALSALLWIPGLMFFCGIPYIFCTQLVDWERIKKGRRIQFRRNNIEMVPTKSGSGSHNKKKKKRSNYGKKKRKKTRKIRTRFLGNRSREKKRSFFGQIRTESLKYFITLNKNSELQDSFSTEKKKCKNKKYTQSQQKHQKTIFLFKKHVLWKIEKRFETLKKHFNNFLNKID